MVIQAHLAKFILISRGLACAFIQQSILLQSADSYDIEVFHGD